MITTPRTFKITNSRGETLDLMDKNKYGASPEGLGLSISREYFKSYGSFEPSSQELDLPIIKLTLVSGGIKGDPYKAFQEAMYILNDKELILSYWAEGILEGKRRVNVKSVEKSDIDELGVLATPIEFECLTPWYEWRYISYEVQKLDWIPLKAYIPYYTYGYMYGTSNQDTKVLVFNNDSLVFGLYSSNPISIEITADAETGDIVNPEWRVIDEKGKLLYKQKYITTIYPGYKLQVVSDWFKPTSYLINVNNPEQKFDISNNLDEESDGYTRLPIGKSYFYLNNDLISIFEDNINDYVKVGIKIEKMVI